MIKTLSLTNFGVHRNLVLDFTQGLNVIRGGNEAGKTTILQGISYALCGTSGLVEKTTADLATWGMPESSFKVELSFEHMSKDYTLKRSKAGATLVGENVSVTGHTGVTTYIEDLFGLPAKLMLSTLIASQQSLSDHVKTTGKDTIQSLAKLDLIDVWAKKFKATQPTGLTKPLENQISLIDVSEPSSVDLKAAEDKLQNSLTLVNPLREKYGHKSTHICLNQVVSELTRLQGFVERERELLANLATLEADQTDLSDEVVRLTNLADGVTVNENRTGACKVLEQAQSENWLHKLQALIPTLNQALTFKHWGFDLKAADAELDAQFFVKHKELQNKTKDIAVVRSQLITEKTCGLCGKDISEIPEVQLKNNNTNATLTLWLDQERELQEELKQLEQSSRELQAVLNEQRRKETDLGSLLKEKPGHLLGALSDFLREDDTGQIHWAWSDTASVQPQPHSAAALLEMELAASRSLNDLNKKKDAAHKLEGVKASVKLNSEKIRAIQAAILELSHTQSERQAALLQAQTQKIEIDHWISLEVLVTAQESTVRALQGAYKAEMQRLDSNLKAVEGLKKLLAETHRNNQLLHRLSEIKQKLGDELWSSLLAAVSTTLTQIRGKPADVGLQGEAFTLDGQKWSLHSGSTRDALGLAIRITLLNYFLPSVGFVILDEPGGAMSDERESNMLATLSALGLKQVLLVTHRDVAENFAHNLIEL